MALNEVLALLTIIGGTVYITFQISWEVFKEIQTKRNDRPSGPNSERSFLLT